MHIEMQKGTPTSVPFYFGTAFGCRTLSVLKGCGFRFHFTHTITTTTANQPTHRNNRNRPYFTDFSATLADANGISASSSTGVRASFFAK